MKGSARNPQALLSSLEERLTQHVNNRREIQTQAQGTHARTAREADPTAISFSEDVRRSFSTTEKRIGSLIDLLNDRVARQEIRGADFLMRQVQYKLSTLETYEVQYTAAAKACRLTAVSVTVPVSFSPGNINFNNPSDVIRMFMCAAEQLKGHLNKNREAVNRVLARLDEINDAQSEAEKRINGKLEPLFRQETERLQNAANFIRANIGSGNLAKLESAMDHAMDVLLVKQQYFLCSQNMGQPGTILDLTVKRDLCLEYLNPGGWRPVNVSATLPSEECVSISFGLFEKGEASTLREHNVLFNAEMNIWENGNSESNSRAYTTTFIFGSTEPICFCGEFRQGTKYFLKVRVEKDGAFSKWSDVFELIPSHGPMFGQFQNSGFVPQPPLHQSSTNRFGSMTHTPPSGFGPQQSAVFTSHTPPHQQSNIHGSGPHQLPAPTTNAPGSTSNTPGTSGNITNSGNGMNTQASTSLADFQKCAWKKCPAEVSDDKKYALGPINPRIATFEGNWRCDSVVIGNTQLPLNQEVTWHVKLLSFDNSAICVGVAPSDINQNGDDNQSECGWYLMCCNSTLHSGPPQNLEGKKYGPRKEEDEEYVKKGDTVGVVMDTTKGELSFVLEGVNLGVAFEGIPLDKPLVPCVLLVPNESSVELII